MSKYTLRRGYEQLGTLEVVGIDQPWFMCRFEATPAFESPRPLFDEELKLLEQDWQDNDGKEREAAYLRACSRIDELGLCIGALDGGNDITEFLLHIEGEEAWFRY